MCKGRGKRGGEVGLHGRGNPGERGGGKGEGAKWAPYLPGLLGVGGMEGGGGHGVHLEESPHGAKESLMPQKQGCHLPLQYKHTWCCCCNKISQEINTKGSTPCGRVNIQTDSNGDFNQDR